jgi:hypothetical protein
MIPDIRARVYCSLGRVISGDFSDDYLQASGLVRTRGSVLLDGIYAPAVGDKVEFAYYRNGIISKLPRTLRVLSSFADPFKRVTTVEIGCKFTYFSNRKPPLKNPTSQEENSIINCEVYKTAIIPISAKYVFEQCLSALGLQSDEIPLTNKFSLEEFDLSPGYIQVMSDLLSSEGYFCYLDESETVRIRSFNETTSTGPLLRGNQVIDLAPIGVGELPGDAIVVNFDSLTLKKPEELSDQDKAIQNWEYESSTIVGGKIEIQSWGKLIDSKFLTVSTQNARTSTYNDYTITETWTYYDAWNRVSKRERITRRPLVAVNQSYVQQVLDFAFWYPEAGVTLSIGVINWSIDPPLTFISGADAPCDEKEVEIYYYGSNPDPSQNNPCAIPSSDSLEYDSLLRKETLKYESQAKIYGAVWNKPYFKVIVGSIGINPYTITPIPNRTADYLTGKTIEYYDKKPSDMTSVSQDLINSGLGLNKRAFQNVMTKQVTERYIARFYTQSGQKYINNATSASWDSFNAEYAFAAAMAMGDLNVESVEFSQVVGRNAGIDARPTATSLSNAANAKNDITESVAEIEWITGSTESNAVIELQMPYAPDDEITYSEQAGYGLIKSDAKAKAANYGRIQNALLLGNRNGVSVQMTADIMPPRPFDPIYIEADGLRGQYRINGTSYTFDVNGIIASTDALFWGGVSA